MDEEIELGWLKLADGSDLVLTNLHVSHYKNRGMFGEIKTIIPRVAIAMVRIGWQRSKVVLAVGVMLLIACLALVAGTFLEEEMGSPVLQGFFSSFVASLAQYGSLLSAIGILTLFWFYKKNEIQIIAPTGTIGGTPKSYDDARTFCGLLLSDGRGRPAPTRKAEEKTAERGEVGEVEWHL